MSKTNPFEDCVLVNLDVHKIGDRRQVPESVVEDSVRVDSDKSLLKMSKRILECPEYEAIKEVLNKARKELRRKALPVKFVKGGIYALPAGLVKEADVVLEEAQAAFYPAVQSFLNAYEGVTQKTCDRLKVLGDNGDYAPLDAVKDQFWFRWEYITMGPPGTLQRIDAKLWEREKEKASRQWAEAADQVVMAMRQGMLEVVAHMADIISPDEEGKKKRFKGSSVEKLREFLADFPMKNIGNDESLAEVVKQAELMLDGVDPEKLRKDDVLREKVSSGMATIKVSLEKLVGEAPNRLITVED